MNICVFDTETTSLNKPFCYNVGFVFYDTCKDEIILKKDYVIEQIWHNLELFNTAYYAEKRNLYITAMRKHETIMLKWGYVMQAMIRLFKQYNIQCAYAYNSNFDDKVFSFNSDWFKTQNPFDNVPIYDIRGNAHTVICNTNEYKAFCESMEFFTDSKSYSTTAETVYRYITQKVDFIEEHTALSDSLIELEILKKTIALGCSWDFEYKAKASIERPIEKTLQIVDTHKNNHYFNYYKMRINKDKTKIILS